MEAIRSIQTASDGEVHLSLPKQFWGKEVEIIVLASPRQKILATGKKSMRGTLKQYARPDLIDQEKGAWQAVAEEKYENR